MNKPNIFWIIPDGIRCVEANDGLSRMRYFDLLAKTSIEFTKTYCTAPSTNMSVASFLTGIPPLHYSNRYDYLKDNDFSLISIFESLQNHGYHCYAFSQVYHVREMFYKYFSAMEKHYNRKDFINYYTALTGAESKKIALDFIKNNKLQEPFFLFYHWITEDGILAEPGIFSTQMEELMGLLQHKYNMEESISIIHSDHGYPLYKGESNKEFMWQHDLVMSNVNMQVPLFLHYPGCQQGIKVEDPVSLIDIVPTLSQLLGLSDNQPLSCGTSLLQSFPERIIRVDNRYQTQDFHLATIIYQDRKIIYNYDTKELQSYDIQENCKELQSQTQYTDLLDVLLKEDTQLPLINQTLQKHLTHRRIIELNKNLHLYDGQILTLQTINHAFFEPIFSTIRKAINSLYLAGNRNAITNYQAEYYIPLEKSFYPEIVAETPDFKLGNWDCILFVVYSLRHLDYDYYQNIFNFIASLSYKQVIIIDREYNFASTPNLNDYLELRKKVIDLKDKRIRMQQKRSAKEKVLFFSHLTENKE